MNDYIYAIYDRLAARYGSPFAACNDMVAARLALMIKGGYNKALDGLFRIGVFSNSSGAIEPCEPFCLDSVVSDVIDMIKHDEKEESNG